MKLNISFVCVCLNKGEVNFNNKLFSILICLLVAQVSDMPTRSATREVGSLFSFTMFKDRLIKGFNNLYFSHKSEIGVYSCYLSDCFNSVLVVVAKVLDFIVQYLKFFICHSVFFFRDEFTSTYTISRKLSGILSEL